MAVFLRSLDESESCEKHGFSKLSVCRENSFVGAVYEPPFPEKKHKVVGCCKGLFLLEYDNNKSLVWNPSNNEVRFLPSSPVKTPLCPYRNCADTVNNVDNHCAVQVISRIRGLGFDHESGDYRVIRFVASYFYDKCKDFSHGCSKQVEVYSLKFYCWKEINPGSEYEIVDECGTYVNGCCYWIAQLEGSECVVSLDLAKEEFSCIRIPSCPGYYFDLKLYGYILMEFNRSLSLVI